MDDSDGKVIPFEPERARRRVTRPSARTTRKPPPAPPPRRRSPEKSILALVHENADIFADHTGAGFAEVETPGGGVEVLALASKDFERWLDQLLLGAYETLPRRTLRRDVIGLLRGNARFDAPRAKTALRVAAQGQAVLLDPGGTSGEVIKIEPSGWTTVPGSSVRFRRPGTQHALARPMGGGALDDLREMLNLEHNTDWYLVAGWLVAALRPEGPKPLLVLTGEQGAAKSTTARFLKRLIDPTAAPLRSLPKTERDLAVMASQGWVLAFDNLSVLSPKMSDALCRMSTGGGLSRRQVYTDAGEIVFDFIRPVILTGIEDVVTRPDLRERSVIVELPRFTKRVDESTLERQFQRLAPYLLGSLLDGVASAMRHVDDVVLANPPRMADFARWVTAAEEGLGWPPGSFVNAYESHRVAADLRAADEDLVASLIPGWMGRLGAREWIGTAAELLAELEPLTQSRRRGDGWPGSASALSRHLKRVAPLLRSLGFDVRWLPRNASRREIEIAVIT